MTINQPTWLKRALLVGLTILVCWTGAIWYWRTGSHEPAVSEVLFLLLVLPAIILAASWFGSGLLSRATAPSQAAARQELTEPAKTHPFPSLTIVAASASLPHGATLGEFAAAIAKDQVRIELDHELVDNHDLPIKAARSEEALNETLQEEIAEWFSSVGIKVQLDAEQWRALVLGTTVVRELSVYARSLLALPESARPILKLIPLLPTEWEHSQLDAIAKWLGHTFLQCGWPAARFETAEVTGDRTRNDLSIEIDRLLNPPAHEDISSAVLVVACASHIGQQTVDQWAARSTLFTPTNPDGDMPGEGAAGLLLTVSTQAAASTLPTTLLHLGKRAKRVPQKRGEQSSPEMEAITREVLNNAQVRTNDIAAIVADTNAHSKRVFELMNFVATSMKQLDGSTDVVRLGAIIGASHSVPFIAALGMAHHYVLEGRAPILVVENADPEYLCASVVQAVPNAGLTELSAGVMEQYAEATVV